LPASSGLELKLGNILFNNTGIVAAVNRLLLNLYTGCLIAWKPFAYLHNYDLNLFEEKFSVNYNPDFSHAEKRKIPAVILL
jgi:hypothetical protein